MIKRKPFLVLLSAGVLATGIGAAEVVPAAAAPRTLTLTLLGGGKITITVNLPPGTPLDKIKLPNIHLPILSISEGTPAPGTSTAPTIQLPQPGAVIGKQAPSAVPQSIGQEVVQQAGSAARRAHKVAGKLHELSLGFAHHRPHKRPLRANGGIPTPANPTYSLALPGPVLVGVPNFYIERFSIPPFLFPIYQAAGIEYSVPWQVLAAINEIETDYGRNLSVSTAGAVGWMQFLPSTWRRFGLDANNDGRKDPYNPVDAIFTAARYLRAAGAEQDLRKAIFAYNHADWYVQSVLLRARLVGGLPADLVGSLTGLAEGHFPVAATARYADDITERVATRRLKALNQAVPDSGDPARRSISIFARKGAPVIAVNDGRIKRIGSSPSLGRYIVLQDVYGNRYTYAHLGSISKFFAVPKPQHVSPRDVARELRLPAPDPAPLEPATAGVQRAARHAAHATGHRRARVVPQVALHQLTHVTKERLFANPTRPNAYRAGGAAQLAAHPQLTTFRAYFSRALRLNRHDVVLRHLRVGSTVIGGTILGRIGKTVPQLAPHLMFMIRPAGRGAPTVDPKPILDGWKLLEATAIYRAAGKNPFVGRDARNPTIGQILLMSKEQLERRVLADPRIQIYDAGRRDVEAGVVDRRVLATLEFLVASGLNPSVSSLRSGHSYLTKSGNVSEHSGGDAVDIAAINGIPILGHQGAGSIADLAIRRLLTLQGTMKPHQIISLMTFQGADNTLSLPDHADHIHVGFHPLFGANTRLGREVNRILAPGQWIKLIDRLSRIPNPVVSLRPSHYAIKDEPATRQD